MYLFNNPRVVIGEEGVLVVDAQAADYFVVHDDKEELRNFAQAKQDAAALFKARQAKNDTQRKQQQRRSQAKKKPGM